MFSRLIESLCCIYMLFTKIWWFHWLRLKIPNQTHQQCLSILSGLGKKVSGMAVGILLEVYPVEISYLERAADLIM